MLDDNLFKDYSIEISKNESIYILHFDFNSKIISYGNIKQMSENNIYHIFIILVIHKTYQEGLL